MRRQNKYEDKKDIVTSDPELDRLYKALNDIERACRKNPGFNNLIGWEMEWRKYPALFDILDKHSEQYYLKQLEKDIYMKHITPFLKNLQKGAYALDAGAGIGRFGIELVQMGYHVALVDNVKSSLKIALKHLAKRKIKMFELYHANIDSMSRLFKDNTFDAVFAIESVCYTSDPLKTMKELLRVTKKNGFLFVSVEGLYGAILSDPQIPENMLLKLIGTGVLSMDQNVHTHYYTKQGFERLLKNGGATIVDIHGTHYVPEGIFNRLIDMPKLSSTGYRKRIAKIEAWLKRSPEFSNLARSWLGIIRK